MARSASISAAKRAASAARADSIELTWCWRSWKRLSSGFGLYEADTVRPAFDSGRVLDEPKRARTADDFGGALVARFVCLVDNTGALGIVRDDLKDLVDAIEDKFVAVLDGRRGC